MSRSYMANGNVRAARFVKLDTSKTGGWILQAGGGDRPIGVSQLGVRQAPIDSFDDGFAGVQGVNEVSVFEAEDECWIEIGSSVTVNDYLKPSTNGVAVTASSVDDVYGAIALETSSTANTLVRCRVTAPSYRSA